MLSACGQIFNEAQSLHFPYGSLVALSTLSPMRYLLRPKTRFPVRRLHLLSGREFHPLKAPGLSWRTIMQKQISQQWASHSSLGSALLPWNQSPVLFLHWRFQPALDIENDPLLRSMLLHCPKQEVLRKAVKEALDVQI